MQRIETRLRAQAGAMRRRVHSTGAPRLGRLLLSLAPVAVVLVAAALPAIGIATAAADDGEPRSGADRPPIKVCVSVLPEAFIVNRVGGDRVSVTTMAGAGQSPHAFEPTPALIAKLSDSDVCFTLGLPFETTVLRDLVRSDPSLVVFDAAAGIERRTMEDHSHDASASDEGHEGAARPGGHGATGGAEPDPHIWLSPKAAALIAANVRDGLVAFDPADSTYFNANLETLEGELAELDAELTATLAPYAEATVFVFHPAYGYFTDEYGLHQAAIEVEGKEPSPRDLVRVISEAERDGARVIFVQPQQSARIARTVANEIGARVVVLDPLAYDYFGELRKMATEMASALAAPPPRTDENGRGTSEGR